MAISDRLAIHPAKKEDREADGSDRASGLPPAGILAYFLVIVMLHTSNDTLESYDVADHPHPAVRLLASQMQFAEFLVQYPQARARYQIGWREGLRVIAHDAEQTQTLRLRVHERHRVEAKLVPLTETVRRTLWPIAKTYDFATGRWIAPAPWSHL